MKVKFSLRAGSTGGVGDGQAVDHKNYNKIQ